MLQWLQRPLPMLHARRSNWFLEDIPGNAMTRLLCTCSFLVLCVSAHSAWIGHLLPFSRILEAARRCIGKGLSVFFLCWTSRGHRLPTLIKKFLSIA